jgi:adenylate cyclase class 2
MATEIELKVWIDDVSSIEKRLDSSMVCTGRYTKHDEYWRSPQLELGNGIRLRIGEDGVCTVNWKHKEVRDSIEVNDEHEFTVSSRDEYALFLQTLGFSPWIRKVKRGKAWHDGTILAELSEIEDLGHFLELEILAGDDSPATITAARKALFDCLDRLGISRERIETRYYTSMLAEKSGK